MMIRFVAFALLFSFAQAGELDEKMSALATKRSAVNRKIDVIFKQEKLYQNPEFKKAEMDVVRARNAFESAARKLPATKGHCDRLQAARKMLSDSIQTSEKTDDQKAMKAINQATTALYRDAGKIPELAPLTSKLKKAHAARKTKRRLLVDTTPKGKLLINEWIKLNQAMKALSQNMKK